MKNKLDIRKKILQIKNTILKQQKFGRRTNSVDIKKGYNGLKKIVTRKNISKSRTKKTVKKSTEIVRMNLESDYVYIPYTYQTKNLSKKLLLYIKQNNFR